MSLQPPFGDANKTCCKLLWGMGILTHQDSTQTVGWILGFPCRWKRLQYSMFIVEVLLACAQEVCLLGIFLHIFTNIFLFDQYIYIYIEIVVNPTSCRHHPQVITIGGISVPGGQGNLSGRGVPGISGGGELSNITKLWWNYRGYQPNYDEISQDVLLRGNINQIMMDDFFEYQPT